MNNLIYRTKPTTTLKLLVIGAACALALTTPAQTISVTNQVPNLLTNQVSLDHLLGQVSVSKDLTQVTSDLLAEIEAMQPFTTNGNATAKLAAGENTSSKQLVLALLVEVPVTPHTSIGALGAFVGGMAVTASRIIGSFSGPSARSPAMAPSTTSRPMKPQIIPLPDSKKPGPPVAGISAAAWPWPTPPTNPASTSSSACTPPTGGPPAHNKVTACHKGKAATP
jgi:hypothetical protein